MWRHALLLLCSIALLRAPVSAAELGEPYFEAVGDAESIPDNNVTALVQDRQGFLWIGTPNGLLRYDGYRFRRYTHSSADPHSLGGVFIRSLLLASDGRLIVGTDTDGISVFDSASGRFQVLRHIPGDRDSLSHNHVRALAGAPDGGVFIGTREGLDHWRPGATTFTHHRHDEAAVQDADRIQSLLLDRRGDLWAGSWTGLSRLRRGETRPQRVQSDPGDALAGQAVVSLFELADGRIVVATAAGHTYTLDPQTLALAALAQPGDGVVALGMAQPSPDVLWLAGLGGINLVDVGSGRLLRAIRNDPAVPSGLAHTDVRALLLDRSGLIWVGGYSGGLQRHDPRNTAIRVLRHSPARPNTLSHPSVSSVLELTDGTIWAGTRGSGIDIVDRERGVVRRIPPQPGVPGALGNGIVTALAETGDGSVWAGTDGGLFRYEPRTRQFRHYGIPQRLPRNNVRTLRVTGDGALWIGTDSGIARWTAADDRIEQITVAGGAPIREDVNAIAESADGRLWVGAASSLYTAAAGARELEMVSGEGTHSLRRSLKVVGLLVDRQQRIWVDTPEGLFQLRYTPGTPAEFRPVSERLRIAGQPFGANLLEDARGRIWSPRFVFTPAAGTVYQLSRADGADIGTAWFRSYWKTRDGLLLYGGGTGLMLIDPERFAPRQDAPAVVATELKIDGISQPGALPADGFTLLAGQRSFSLEFAALDFTAPRRLRYAYRLQGFDHDWIETDASHRIVSYSNLWPGDYRLEVRGSNRHGVFSPQPLEVPIRVLPAYWQTPWFAGLVLLALWGVAYLGHRWRTARIRAQRRELQRMVEQRTEELLRAKQRAEIALEQLLGAQKQLIEAEKMASLGQLVAGVAHEINTPLGVALTASSMLHDRSDELRQRFVAGELKRQDLAAYLDIATDASAMVDHNLHRAAELVRSFKQVSVDRSADWQREFDLGQMLADLVTSLEPTWKSQPLSLDCACPAGLLVNTYPGALGQVVSQFVQNALRHGYAPDQAGTMRIHVRELAGGMIELEFSDDGAGIAEKDLPHVFEPFFTTRRALGPGLGLHIVYNLVRARLHGDIDVRSPPGQGCVFRVRFPKIAPAAVDVTAAALAAPG